jgi:hypothetical protein
MIKDYYRQLPGSGEMLVLRSVKPDAHWMLCARHEEISHSSERNLPQKGLQPLLADRTDSRNGLARHGIQVIAKAIDLV